MSFLQTESAGVPRLVLPAIVDLTMAAALKQDCQAALAGGAGLLIDASAVSRITSPCLQVLTAVVRGAVSSGGPAARFEAVSDYFRECVTRLALADALGLGSEN